jgi:cytochrome c oxidase subunit 1
MWRGQVTLNTPMLFSIGFLVTFLLGGLTGVLLASPPVDVHVHDTYFVVAHFHYVLFGTIVFAVFAGLYFWFPKMTGRMLDDRLGKVHFWLTFIGFHTTFLVQHWLGAEGMARRYADYLPTDGFTTLNTISTVGAFILGASTLPFLYNVWKSYRIGEVVTVDDPWGYGNSLEWATSCPPPLRNFDHMVRIRSERPAFDAKYGERVSDLGRDLRTGDAPPVQSFGEVMRPGDGPDGSDVPAPGGAVGSGAAEEHRPDETSGARGVRVPEPSEIRTEDAAEQPERASWDASITDRDSTSHDRHGGEPPTEDEDS